jgi:cellulose synthase operon protein C
MNKTPLYCCLPVLLPALCLAGDPTQTSNDAQQPAKQGLVAAGPDERILWSLFHAGKIDALKRQIADLQQRFPGWQVPVDLQNALNQGVGKTQEIAKPSSKKPRAAKAPLDACAHIDQKWASAEAQLAKGRRQAAAKRYERIIVGCKNPDLVRASLEKAVNLTDRSDYFNLTALAVGVLPDAELQRLEYRWLKNAYLRQPASGSERRPVDDTELQVSAEGFRDGDLATVMAWRYFDQQRYRDAYVWFDKAGQWNPAGNDAVQGKMLSLEKLGDYDAALALHPTSSTDVKLNEIAGRLYKIKAWQAIKASQPQQAEQDLAKARALVGEEDPEIQEIEAWIADGRQEYAKAAALFDTLYRRSPGTEYARAYVRNQSQIDSDGLANNAEQSGGLMQDEYGQYLGRELYYRKQFLAAQDIAPNQFSNLANIDAPSADLGVYARHKKGGPGPEQGLNELDILKMPVAGGSYTLGGVHQFKLSLSRVELSSSQRTTVRLRHRHNRQTDRWSGNGVFISHGRLVQSIPQAGPHPNSRGHRTDNNVRCRFRATNQNRQLGGKPLFTTGEAIDSFLYRHSGR